MKIKSSKCRKPTAALLTAAAALSITLTPKPVDSYATGSMENPSVHQFLVDKLIAFHPSAKYDITAIKRGTVNEDSPGNLAADTLHRYVHHFQHWQTGKGIYDFAPVKEWAMNGDLQKDYPFGDHSWNKVQEEYETGTIGESFGSIFHLIADLTVPAHTRSDPHPFSSSPYMEELTSGLWPADFYEVWTHENRNKIMGAVVPKNIPPVESISDVFDGLAQFTGSNFYSDTKVDGSVDCNWEGKYCMREVEGQKVRVLRQGFFRKFPDRACLEDSWKILGGKAVEYGAAAAGLLESSSSCTSHASKVCSNGDVYWEDSCGALEDKIKDCTGTEKCENGECLPTSQEKFVDQGNGTIKDTQTGRIWQKESPSEKVIYYDAEKYCQNLKLGGLSNWTIPETPELETLCSPPVNGCSLNGMFKGPCGGNYENGYFGKKSGSTEFYIVYGEGSYNCTQLSDAFSKPRNIRCIK